ncbi:hypothetical protein A3Q56_01062 [Intoshia linei]|uniref:RRM domain-containing protein n=1 Tax=Intoshia linei TaxID=1819745 RepID=A0A177BCG4_9BILA|nr:hypothetical protein A3Q56_01062 [Intoshia linei]
MNTILRLDNLSSTARSADVRNFFRKFRIKDGGVNIGRDGITLVEFSSYDDAINAVRLSGQYLCGLRVRLTFHGEKEVIDNNYHDNQDFYNSMPPDENNNEMNAIDKSITNNLSFIEEMESFMEFVKFKKLKNQFSQPSTPQQPSKRDRRDIPVKPIPKFNKPTKKSKKKLIQDVVGISDCIFVENIPRPAVNESIKNFFGMCEIMKDGIKFSKSNNAMYSNCYLRFVNFENAKIAMRFNGMAVVGGTNIRIKYIPTSVFMCHRDSNMMLNESIENRLVKPTNITPVAIPNVQRIHITGLPVNTNHQEFINAAKPYQINESWIYIAYNDKGEALGDAYVRPPDIKNYTDIIISNLFKKPFMNATYLKYSLISKDEMTKQINAHKAKYFNRCNTDNETSRISGNYNDMKFYVKVYLPPYIKTHENRIIIRNLRATTSRKDILDFMKEYRLENKDVWFFVHNGSSNAVVCLPTDKAVYKVLDSYDEFYFGRTSRQLKLAKGIGVKFDVDEKKKRYMKKDFYISSSLCV